MEHVQDPRKVFEEIYRVLMPNGIAYISTCNYDSFYEGHYRRFWNPFIGAEGNRKRFAKKGLSLQFFSELNFITKKKINKWVKEIGFSDIIYNPHSEEYKAKCEIKPVYPDGFVLPSGDFTGPTWLHKKIESPRIASFLSKFDREYKLYFILKK